MSQAHDMTSSAARRRRAALAATAASTLAIVGATLYPFRFCSSLAQVRRRARWIEWELYYTDREGHLTLDLDLVQNLALFLPLGVALAFLPESPRPRRDALVALAVGGLLSAAVEALQLLTLERVTQLADVWRNAVGAALGALVGALVRARLRGGA
ncbi:MAG TPA: VanZ family protein [Polyangiaceae bacterium]|nr:VanZ family protein [Polyangiaceae bacterium]